MARASSGGVARACGSGLDRKAFGNQLPAVGGQQVELMSVCAADLWAAGGNDGFVNEL